MSQEFANEIYIEWREPDFVFLFYRRWRALLMSPTKFYLPPFCALNKLAVTTGDRDDTAQNSVLFWLRILSSHPIGY